MNDNDSLIALVTGASRGIGREIALELARHGVDVVLAARNPGPAEEAVAEIEGMGRRAMALAGPDEALNTLNNAVVRRRCFNGVMVLSGGQLVLATPLAEGGQLDAPGTGGADA